RPASPPQAADRASAEAESADSGESRGEGRRSERSSGGERRSERWRDRDRGRSDHGRGDRSRGDRGRRSEPVSDYDPDFGEEPSPENSARPRVERTEKTFTGGFSQFD